MADDSSSSSPPRRHWNGEVGSRHEHQNVWMNGGVRGTAPTAPWAGWDANKKRRPSESSTKSTGSNSSGKLFESLSTQKRGSVSHPERRKSYAEMLPQPGFIGKLWHDYTTGGSK